MKSISLQNHLNDKEEKERNNGITETKSKFSSSALDKLIQLTKETKDVIRKDSLDFHDLENNNDNLIIFHRRGSGDTIDNYSINEDNFLDRSFLQLMNSVTIENININASNYLSDDDKKTKKERNPKKKFNTTILSKKPFQESPSIKMVNDNSKIKTELFVKRVPSIFLEDDAKINHSFNSDIHLKNNKNFIPKEQLMKSGQGINPVQRSKSDKKVCRYLEDDEKPKSNMNTLNYYTSVCSGFRQKGHNKSHSMSVNEIRDIAGKNVVPTLSKFNSFENNSIKEDIAVTNNSIKNIHNFPIEEMSSVKYDLPTTIITDSLHDLSPSINQNNIMFNQTNNFQQQYYQINSSPLLNFNSTSQFNNLQLLNNANYQQGFFYGYNLSPSIINNTMKLDSESIIKNKVLNNMSTLSDEELFKNACLLSKDQNGCRYLQKKIEENPNFGNNNIFPNIKNDLIEISNDSFGNYLVQKVVETLDEENICTVLDIFKSHIYMCCINPHGTRVVQKIIDTLTTNKLIDKFIELIQPIMMELMIDMNGNHVIQKIVSTMKRNEFIYEFLLNNYYNVSRNKFGCCAMQKCLEYSNLYYKQILITMIIKNTHLFICDQYANYVLQYIISLNNHEINHQIANFLLYNIETLATQKFASNVIEKVFDNSNEITKNMIVTKLADSEIIRILIMDMYGNYVIQKALSVAKEPYRSFFIQNIIIHFDKLKLVSYGTKLCQRLINTYPEFGILLNQRSFMMNNMYIYNQMGFNPYNSNTGMSGMPVNNNFLFNRIEDQKRNNFYN